MQTVPHAPHMVFDSLARGSHVTPLQQPVQELPPHEQAPPEHASPLAHEPQAAPPVPHDVADCVAYNSHTLPLQQPPGHEVASQTHRPVLPLHSWPAAHAEHAAPPAPHDVWDSLAGSSHVPLAVQQPVHDDPPHEHRPAEHA